MVTPVIRRTDRVCSSGGVGAASMFIASARSGAYLSRKYWPQVWGLVMSPEGMVQVANTAPAARAIGVSMGGLRLSIERSFGKSERPVTGLRIWRQPEKTGD